MILIADSGSTKADWALVDGNQPFQCIHTEGINPFHQSHDDIRTILMKVSEGVGDEMKHVYFYGSGIRPELKTVMEGLLREIFPMADRVEASSDMLGAARALCGHNYGIASILGTGANSCLYDGERIVMNTPALGYILGDEGSGAVLGRRFLNALYKGVLSREIKADFEASMRLTMADVINKVYREPLANRFLASLSEYIHQHLDDDGVREVVIGNFRDFFLRNIQPYSRRDLPVSFVGSIAWYYQDQLREAAAAEDFEVGTIVRAPLESLVAYHAL